MGVMAVANPYTHLAAVYETRIYTPLLADNFWLLEKAFEHCCVIYLYMS